MLAWHTTEFMGLQLNIIDYNQQLWLTAEQVGLALGFVPDNARKDVNKLFNCHEDEFTAQDSTIAVLTTVDNKQGDVRIFSQSGCNLLSFFANTPRAKQFRAWAKQALVNIQRENPIECMANSVEKLAQGMNVLVRKCDHTDKYIGLLEQNQRGHVKITWEIAQQIKQLKAQGMPQASIARRLRVSASSVSLVVKDKYQFSEHAGVPDHLELSIQQERQLLEHHGIL